MAGRLSPVGLFTKWVVVPLALAAVGYFIIGPSFGGSASKEKAAASDLGPPNADPPVDTAKPKSGPAVDATSDSSSSATDDSMPKPIVKKHKKKHAQSNDDGSSSSLDSNKTDEGGSAGATTSG